MLTIPYVKGEDGRSPAVDARMLVEIDGRRRPIESVYEEGFRKKLHILITLERPGRSGPSGRPSGRDPDCVS